MPRMRAATIDPYPLARTSGHQFRVGVWPRHLVEESEQLVRNETAARSIDMVVPLRVLAVGEKALRNHEVQIVPGARHGDGLEDAL